jgi:hypothetical protein
MAKTKAAPVAAGGTTTKVLHCNCSHAGQDAMYGSQNRMHNATKGGKSSGAWRCTACATTRTA